MPRSQTRSERIEARITPDVLAIVRRAAELQSRSMSDFIVAAAEEAARKTIEETHVINLAVEDQQRFVDLLLNPPPPTPALKRARDHHEQLIGPL